jgi:osmotically-inducible protein OsmY
LKEDLLLDAGGIFISVSGGRVLIEGSVETDEAKHRAETHSRQVSGISGLRDWTETAHSVAYP